MEVILGENEFEREGIWICRRDVEFLELLILRFFG